eukprot:3938722-Rhodomonas_salina.2
MAAEVPRPGAARVRGGVVRVHGAHERVLPMPRAGSLVDHHPPARADAASAHAKVDWASPGSHLSSRERSFVASRRHSTGSEMDASVAVIHRYLITNIRDIQICVQAFRKVG